ncbi:Rieske [2Fe-2S] iron-sulfur domain-containing protein, partial [Sordaria sp. MPI-SDFR-AT-0083]
PEKPQSVILASSSRPHYAAVNSVSGTPPTSTVSATPKREEPRSFFRLPSQPLPSLRSILFSDSPSTDTMAPVSIAARAAMRAAAPARAVRALSTSTALQGSSSSTFESPFKGESKASKIPDFGKYMSKGSGSTNMLFSYFMVGTMGAITAAGAKSTIQEFLKNMSASADVLAMAKVEVDLASIPEGKNVIIKWRGKPVFIRHRTAAEIDEANQVNVSNLRDPQADADRVKKPEWLVMLGVCTHLGCVPIGEAGDFGGWFCPCHGSHYDISGRIRKGPAPLNLEIPNYEFPEDGKLVIG